MKTTYSISIFTEDIIGLLSRVTIIFTRRHINVESITASESEIKGIYRYTIVITVSEEQVKKIVSQIEKQVDVLIKGQAAFLENKAPPIMDISMKSVS